MGLLDALRDFGQGASNAVASNVSAPVDGLAWLLRKGGLPINNPVGGSDWMAQRGLTAEPKNRLAGLLGESFGGIAPMLAGAYAPKIANGLLSLDDKAMDMGRRAIENRMVDSGMIQPATVWHGSPHKFDKFDSSKIGTGEGAQAYGHGLYLAENPEVAGQYQKMLSGTKAADGSALNWDSPADVAAMRLHQFGGDKDKAIQWITTGKVDGHNPAAGLPNPSISAANQRAYDFGQKVINEIKAGPKVAVDSGSLYKVDLPDEHIAKMLDWDKPMSQQSASVRKAWQDSKKMLPPNAIDDLGGDLSLMYGKDVRPQDFLNTWESFGQKAGAETALQKAGIPGIRYLDGGSRGAGAGSSNFVVFPGNENLLQILQRNGQPVNGLLGK